jgi:hypothetical protein
MVDLNLTATKGSGKNVVPYRHCSGKVDPSDRKLKNKQHHSIPISITYNASYQTPATTHAHTNSKALCFILSALLTTAASVTVSVAVVGNEKAPAPVVGLTEVVVVVAEEDSVESVDSADVVAVDNSDETIVLLVSACTSSVMSWPFLAQRSISFWREVGRWG